MSETELARHAMLLKKEIEHVVIAATARFHQQTGISVEKIDIKTSDVTHAGDLTNRFVVTGVDLRFRL